MAAPSSKDIGQHIEYTTTPDGTVMATLTLTLPNGSKQQYTAKVDTDEIRRVEGAIIGAELSLAGYGDIVGCEVGFNFGKLIKGVTKGVGKLAKGIATSKVFKLAASGLALAAPILGPFAPAALAVSAGMGIASKLSSAGVAAARGAKNVAQAFANSAKLDASRLTKTPEAAAKLLNFANTKRMRASALQDKPKPAPAPARRALPAPAPARAVASARVIAPARVAPATVVTQAPPTTDVLTLARAGRVRSSDGAAVTADQLLSAHQSGRIYWVHA
jgi:hypothetical protein